MKQYDSANVEQHRSLFLLIGFFIALLLVWFILEWQTVDQPQQKNTVAIAMEIKQIEWQNLQLQPSTQDEQNGLVEKKQPELLPTGAVHVPSFAGGKEALKVYTENKLRYPKAAKQQGIEGIVLVSFYVDSLGRVVRPSVLRSVHPLLDKEAVRLVTHMPRWTPAQQQVVGTPICLPVCFSLPISQ